MATVLAMAAGAVALVADLVLLARSMDHASGEVARAAAEAVGAAVSAETARAESLAAMMVGEPGTAEAIRDGDRDLLLERYGARFRELQEDHSVMQVHFHVPPATSLLRLTDPDHHGDDLSAYRSTVVDAIATGQVQLAVERGVYGIGVRSVNPVRIDDRIVGSLEVVIHLDDHFLTRLAPGVAAEVVLVPDTYVPLARDEYTPLRRVAESTDDGLRVVASSFPAGAAVEVSRLDAVVSGADAVEIDTTVDERRWRLVASPIRDADGEVAAVLVVGADVQDFADNVTFGLWRAVIVALALVATVGVALLVRRGHARQLAAHQDAVEFEGRLTRALQLARHESDVIGLVDEALEELAPGAPVRVLLGDSSRAHLTAALERHLPAVRETLPTPRECPATRTGEVQWFPDPQALDACPHLKRGACDTTGVRSGARCQPIAIEGSTIGVVHVRLAGQDQQLRRKADLLVRRVGDRISTLRAFSESQTQASTDPLTGLQNRRSLESRIERVIEEGRPYAVLFTDLDHFKDVNDTFGHAAGDRALRVFTHVLEDSVRAMDVAGRWGGEEFVVVMPGADEVVAVDVAERVRERLAAALASGDVPRFTVSIGVAESAHASEPYTQAGFDRILAAADAAVLAAKSAGRDRVVVSGQEPPPVERAHPEVVTPGAPRGQ